MTRWMRSAIVTPLLALPPFFAMLNSSAVAQNRALIIGIGTYADPKLGSSPAGSADADIAGIETLLTGTLGFKPAEIRILRDSEATKTAILDGITDWLRPDRKEIEAARKAEEEKAAGQGKKQKKARKPKKKKKTKTKPRRSFLYFAGYGYFQEDSTGEEADGLDEALVPYDAVVAGNGISSWITGMISDDEFSAALKTLDGRRVNVVLDTSHSGHVTRSSVPQARPIEGARAPAIAGAIRSIVNDPMVAKQKSEGGFVETSFEKGSLGVWSAVSASQTALLDTGGTQTRGLFTRLIIDGYQAAMADRNDNGVVSNTELLEYLRNGSQEYCAANTGRCEMGLTPRLDPARAHGGVALRKARKRSRKLTIGVLTDFLVKGSSNQTVIEQIPPSPVRVGDKDIRFRVTSQQDGLLVLLNLTDAGQLVQLYPNQFSGIDKMVRSGRVSANSALTVPDSDYGLQLTATDPGKGHVVAILTRDPVDFGENITARSIGNIPRTEALGSYLPELAAALASPLHAGKVDINTGSATWSVTTRRYEILP